MIGSTNPIHTKGNNVFLVEKTRNTAKELLNKDPQLKKHPLLQKRLKLFRQRIHLE